MEFLLSQMRLHGPRVWHDCWFGLASICRMALTRFGNVITQSPNDRSSARGHDARMSATPDHTVPVASY